MYQETFEEIKVKKSTKEIVSLLKKEYCLLAH
jgi:hypothetical protein